MGMFDDIFGALTGQQTAPQQTIIPTDQLLAQSYGMLGGQVAPGLVAFNQALAPGLTDVQLGVANQLDPSVLGNFRGANKSILDELNLGSQLGDELQNEVIKASLQGNTASGFGASAGGRGLVARDLGITGLDLLRRRQQDALGAGTSGLGVSNRLFDPQFYSQLGAQQAGAIAGDIQQVQAARDEAVNMAENIRQQNFASLLNTGGRIMGSVAGGIFGGPMGAQMGGSIGGSIFQGGGVAGQPRRQAGGGGGGFDLSSIMGMFGGGGGGGIGGPSAGIGAGR